MILEILMAAVGKVPAGGGGAPFVLTGCSISQTQAGTSCANQRKYDVALTYTGDPTGKTISIERNWDDAGWETQISSLNPTAGPWNRDSGGYWGKFEPTRNVTFRVVDDSDAANVATSATVGNPSFSCGV